MQFAADCEETIVLQFLWLCVHTPLCMLRCSCVYIGMHMCIFAGCTFYTSNSLLLLHQPHTVIACLLNQLTNWFPWLLNRRLGKSETQTQLVFFLPVFTRRAYIRCVCLCRAGSFSLAGVNNHPLPTYEIVFIVFTRPSLRVSLSMREKINNALLSILNIP